MACDRSFTEYASHKSGEQSTKKGLQKFMDFEFVFQYISVNKPITSFTKSRVYIFLHFPGVEFWPMWDFMESGRTGII